MTKKQTEIEKWEDKLNLELDVLLGEYVLTGDNERKVNIFEVFDEALKTQREELVKEVKNMGFDMGIFEKWVSPAEIVEDLHKQVLQQLKEKDSDPLPVAKRKEIDVKKFMKIAKDLQKLEKEK